MHFKKNVFKFILAHTLLVLVTVGIGHGVYKKLYTFNWGSTCRKV